MKRPNPTLAGIAREHLLMPTLKRRRADSLDFHSVAVWQVEAALKAAFNAGILYISKPVKSRALKQDCPVGIASAPPLFIPKGTSLVPGKMYLRLYHGRHDPDEQMDDWGFDGPTFGPLSCYVQTYCRSFRIYGEYDNHELWLDTHDDMIRWLLLRRLRGLRGEDRHSNMTDLLACIQAGSHHTATLMTR